MKHNSSESTNVRFREGSCAAAGHFGAPRAVFDSPSRGAGGKRLGFARVLALGHARDAFSRRSCPLRKQGRTRNFRRMGPTREASRRAAASFWRAIARANPTTTPCTANACAAAFARHFVFGHAPRANHGFVVRCEGKRQQPPSSWCLIRSRAFAVPPARRFASGVKAGGDGVPPNTPSGATLEIDHVRVSETDPGAVADAVARLSEPLRSALLRALLKKKPRLTVDETGVLFKEADLDGDESLSREEFDRVLIRFGERGYRTRGGVVGGVQTTDDDDPMNDGRETFRQNITRDQKKLLFLSQAIPFVGFGFMDNAIMIIAGEYIEMSIGATLALSTMAAAGLGNLLSDIAGIGFSSKIELWTEKVLKIRAPELSRAQATAFNARFMKVMGAVVGISIGCILGMFPLLLFDADHDRNLRKDSPKEENEGKEKKETYEVKEPFPSR